MLASCLDELEKIAEEIGDAVSKERFKRGLKATLGGAAAAGLGAAAGGAVGRYAIPRVFKHLTSSQIGKATLVGGALGAAGGLAFQAAKARGQDYAREGD